jgi:mono/diheme cytochrome c family protein
VYKLDAAQRAALGAFLADGLGGSGAPTPAYSARLDVRRFNCLACHNRDGEGGIDEALVDLIKPLEKAENADDLQPPRLTGVGHKLRTSWAKSVLLNAGRARPWLSLRMPQYGPQNVGHLPDALPKLEGNVADDTVGKADLAAANVNAGRQLAGKTGLGCAACHDISGVAGGGTRGPDLATVNQRVRHDWYVRWLHQPQRLAPGTRMPTYFPDGKSPFTTFFKGDADAQIESLWAYLSLGPGLPLPPGTEPPGKALVVAVKDRPEVLRTFMPDGAGSKAVAIGFPGGVSVVFDAAQCRLGYAWTGNFLDASPVWNSRGGAPAKLLGPKFWQAPAGHPWAVTDSRSPPDFGKRAADPAYGHQLKDDEFYGGPRLVHFGGYGLDGAGSPAFRYRLDGPDGKPGLTVTEKASPLPVTVVAGLARSFVVEGAGGKTAWLNAAAAAKEPRVYGPDGGRQAVDLKEDGAEVPVAELRVVAPHDGNRATVLEATAAPAGSVWHFARKPGGGWHVLLRLPEATGRRAEVTLSVWGLPRDDERLLAGLKK